MLVADRTLPNMTRSLVGPRQSKFGGSQLHWIDAACYTAASICKELLRLPHGWPLVVVDAAARLGSFGLYSNLFGPQCPSQIYDCNCGRCWHFAAPRELFLLPLPSGSCQASGCLIISSGGCRHHCYPTASRWPASTKLEHALSVLPA